MKTTGLAVLTGLTLAGALAGWLLAPFGAATTVDSLYYVFAAKSIAQGLGVVQPNIGLEGPALLPMTTWGPGYPAVLALFIAAGLDWPLAAKILNSGLFGVLAAFFVVIARRELSQPYVIMATLALILHPALLTAFSYAWSEPLFVVLVMAAFHAMLRHEEASAGSKRWLIAGGLYLALLCHMRYIGVLFPVAWAVCLLWKPGSWRQRVTDTAVLASVVVLGVLPLLIRNWSITGHLSGAERGVPAFRLFPDILQLLDLMRVVLFGERWWLAVLLGVALSGLLLWARPRPGRMTRLAVIWMVVYFTGLLVIRNRQVVDLDFRMLSVIVPLVLLALATTAQSVVGAVMRSEYARLPALVFGAWALLSVVQGVAVWRVTDHNWRQKGSPEFAAESGLSYNNFTANPAYLPMRQLHRQMAGNAPRTVVFFDFRPLIYQHFTGADTRALPAVLDSGTIAAMNRLGAEGGYVLVTTPEGSRILRNAYGENLEGLRVATEATAFGVIAVRLPLPQPVIAGKP